MWLIKIAASSLRRAIHQIVLVKPVFVLLISTHSKDPAASQAAQAWLGFGGDLHDFTVA